MNKEIKPYTEAERLLHGFILQMLIVAASPEDTSLVIDINPKDRQEYT